MPEKEEEEREIPENDCNLFHPIQFTTSLISCSPSHLPLFNLPFDSFPTTTTSSSDALSSYMKGKMMRKQKERKQQELTGRTRKNQIDWQWVWHRMTCLSCNPSVHSLCEREWKLPAISCREENCPPSNQESTSSLFFSCILPSLPQQEEASSSEREEGVCRSFPVSPVNEDDQPSCIPLSFSPSHTSICGWNHE